MASSTSEIMRHYREDFDPAAYRDRLSKSGTGNFRVEKELTDNSWAELFKNTKIDGTSLLEIGSGPTLHNIVPACDRFTHIVLSDYVESNCEALKKWLRGDPDALDWSKVLCETALAMGYEDPEKKRLEMEEAIRKNVKAVVYCDLLADEIVPEEVRGPYDLVISCLTIEAAAPNYGSYKNCYKKINKLIKPGGYLFLKGFLMGGAWQCGDHDYHHLKVSRQQLEDALKEAGFAEIECQVLERLQEHYSYDFESMYVLRCRKVVKENDK